jgi:hypothetical protein
VARFVAGDPAVVSLSLAGGVMVNGPPPVSKRLCLDILAPPPFLALVVCTNCVIAGRPELPQPQPRPPAESLSSANARAPQRMQKNA